MLLMQYYTYRVRLQSNTAEQHLHLQLLLRAMNSRYYFFNLKDETFVELGIARPLAKLRLHLSTSVRQQTNSAHITLKTATRVHNENYTK